MPPCPISLLQFLNRGSKTEYLSYSTFNCHLTHDPFLLYSCSLTLCVYSFHSKQLLIPKHPQNPGSLSFVLITWNHLDRPSALSLWPHLLLFPLLLCLLATLACLLFLKQNVHLPTFGPLFWLFLLLTMPFLGQPHGLLPSLLAFIPSQSFFPTSFLFALITLMFYLLFSCLLAISIQEHTPRGQEFSVLRTALSLNST